MKSAYGPNVTCIGTPPAPIERAGLSPAQREALVLIFFAGEMNRQRQFYVADGSRPVLGATVNVLHNLGMVKLYVERRKREDGSRIMGFRYYVKLTDRGEWYATTLIEKRQAMLATLAPPIPSDDFEDSPNVYPEEQEAEGLE